MKIISWNLNGLNSCMSHGSFSAIAERKPDVVCLQEIRTKQEPEILHGYCHYWNHGERDGYSGTAILTMQSPISIRNGLEGIDPDDGRLMTAEFSKFFLVNAYVPNAQKNLMRHAYRREWDEKLRGYVCNLRDLKPVIICGDFNVAREDIDIYPENMRQYWAEHGYASDERSDFETLLECGFADAFREYHPGERSYTWWSNRLNKRREDRGWRLDYFLVDEDLCALHPDVAHLKDITGSDHCPIEMEIQT